LSRRNAVFPFVDIVGQEEMKRALILNVIDPGIGGVLLKGEKGTAKSTSVRSLGGVLPRRKVSAGCMFRCDPSDPDSMCESCRKKFEEGTLRIEETTMEVVELPLGATEDRVAGTIDIEHALKTGEKRFEPGVLARANGNLLYIDEVNLLDDHIVDMLLDSAAMGVNYVEREGISFSHPSRFVLVGTMNPEEGDLRPQLLDRFGLSVDIKGEHDPKIRAEIVRRRLEYDDSPEKYVSSKSEETENLRSRISDAISRVRSVNMGPEVLDGVVSVTSHFGIDGHRADIVMMKAARANAAFEGRDRIISDDIISVAGLVLSHRMRRRPFEDSSIDREELSRCLESL
jgi:magnesium chelatase subunit I